VNILDKKFAKTIDLFAPVIEGTVKYGGDVLEVTLIKVEPGKWSQLSPDLSKDELLKRRKEVFWEFI
jgi:dyslexia susceptibility 1 candidate gene 1 protein